MERRKAKRRAVPAVISLEAPSSCGKTYGALVLAAGMVGKNGKIGLIDTERGRGEMYTDDPDIMALIPDGYDYLEITEPFTPEKYIDAVRIFDDCDIVIIDSGSHEWEGSGGCQEIAETNKLGGNPNWALAKMRHKKFMNLVTQSRQNLIICLRAAEKSKPYKDDKGKTKWVEMGVTPICEKNFPFEMTIRIQLDEDYKPTCRKGPREVKGPINDVKLLTPDIGRKIVAWVQKGDAVDNELRALMQECREAAMFGNERLDEFFKNIPVTKKNLLSLKTGEDFKLECRSTADEADRIAREMAAEQAEESETL